jgi:hypothetical protein
MMINGEVCEAVSGMNGWQGIPATVPLCPPQIPHDFTGLEPGPPPWEAGD